MTLVDAMAKWLWCDSALFRPFECAKGLRSVYPTQMTEKHHPDKPSNPKLTVKVGAAEVHLEAQPEIVRQELDRVLDRLFQSNGTSSRLHPQASADDIVAVSVTASKPRPTAPPTETPARPRESALEYVFRARGRQPIAPAALDSLRHTTLGPRHLTEKYSVDPQGRVTLCALPQTASQLPDALLLLLYGMLTLRGEEAVTAVALTAAARASGLRLTRVPRDFTGHGLATGSGQRRGKRYHLTVDGVRHCEQLIPSLPT